GVDGLAAAGGGRTSDRRDCRHHELREPRDRPADARVRPRQTGRRRDSRAPRQEGRDDHDARRRGAHARPRDARDRRPRPRAGGWEATAPTFRVDLLREVDLIEEVGRHYGFDKLEATFPVMTGPAPPPDPRIPRDQLVRRLLTAAGLSEAVTFGFIEAKAAELFVPADDERTQNPHSTPPST